MAATFPSSTAAAAAAAAPPPDGDERAAAAAAAADADRARDTVTARMHMGLSDDTIPAGFAGPPITINVGDEEEEDMLIRAIFWPDVRVIRVANPLSDHNEPVAHDDLERVTVALFELWQYGSAYLKDSYIGDGWLVFPDLLDYICISDRDYVQRLARLVTGNQLTASFWFLAAVGAKNLISAMRFRKFTEGRVGEVMYELRSRHLLRHANLVPWERTMGEPKVHHIFKIMEHFHHVHGDNIDLSSYAAPSTHPANVEQNHANIGDTRLDANELDDVLMPVDEDEDDDEDDDDDHDRQCPVCHEDMNAATARKARCGHVAHLVCWARAQGSQAHCCFMCRRSLVA